MDTQWNAANQLQDELQGSIRRAIQTGRPIITHLNADTSWLIQIPLPQAASGPKLQRAYYNILVDPWLSGPQSDVASWFSTQWHSIASSVQTIEELDDRLRDIDSTALNIRCNTPTGETAYKGKDASYIDLVVVSHEFTDHCHQATLLEMDRSVPVVATEKAASLIQSWNHFDTVMPTPSFVPGTDWRTLSVKPLPQWISVSRIVSPGNKLYYHSAVMISFKLNDSKTNSAEAVIYSPHGIEAKDLAGVAYAEPSIQTLALMHGLHDIGMMPKFQLNLGAHNALKAQRALKASYWVGTHDEVKKGGGLIAPLLRRSALTLQEAVEKEAQETGQHGDLKGVNFAELRSGESLLLV